MMQLISELCADFRIVFASPSARSAFSADLSHLCEAEEIIRLNDSSFDDWVKELDPVVVIFDRFISEEQFGWRVERVCPNTLRVLDTEDLHGLREARRLAFLSGKEILSAELVNDVALREAASIYRCDLTLLVSKAELSIALKEMEIPEHLLSYFPLLTDFTIEQSSVGYGERRHFMTIGTFKHAPNSDAVRFLKDEIWPEIRAKIPDAEMHVYGAYLDKEMASLEDADAGFLMKGRAFDLNDLMRSYRVCLAPLRFGAGIKGKLLETMKNGMPSVTTSVGAEGIAEASVWPGAVADCPLAFANAAADLYLNEKTWNRSVNRIPSVLEHFDTSKWKGKLAETLFNWISTLHLRRTKSFTAAVVGHHSLKSTAYLSQLIELRNKHRSG